MDQILHRKLIIEKNNLQLEVAKANKEIAKLMETVQQYEAVLASLDEGMIPNKMKLRGPVDSAGKHERDFVNRAHQQGRKLTDQEHSALRQHAKNDSAANAKIAAAKGISEDVTVGRFNLSTLARAARKALGGSKKQSTLGKRYTPGTVATSPVDPYVGEVQTPRVAAMGGIPQGAFKQPDGYLGQVRRLTPNEAQYDASKRSNKPVQEATLVRGAEAIKLQAEKSGKKLPTAAEATKKMKEIKAAKELDQAGLGKLKKSRLQIDEVLDTAIDKKVAGNVAKHSLNQVKDEQKMLGRMPGVTPARMTLLAQQQKNRESLMNRLGKKQGVQEGFKDFVKDMGSQLKSIGGDALKTVKKDIGAVTSKLSPANIKAGVKALPGKIEAAAQKMPTQKQNIDFVKNNVVPMVGRVATEMNRSAPKNVQKRNASIGRILKP